MALDVHLDELKEKHSALEELIAAEIHSPGSDSLKISELKREKLLLKDEIAQLETQLAAA